MTVHYTQTDTLDGFQCKRLLYYTRPFAHFIQLLAHLCIKAWCAIHNSSPNGYKVRASKTAGTSVIRPFMHTYKQVCLTYYMYVRTCTYVSCAQVSGLEKQSFFSPNVRYVAKNSLRVDRERSRVVREYLPREPREPGS